MTLEEAEALLGPEECARLARFAAEAPPLTEQQAELLIALFRRPLSARPADEHAA